ncbi:MAG: N-6 DNA methylase [Planctomycetes bacterium]|nr:N-6 DNA methylase [Planctomycetota bacterium]
MPLTKETAKENLAKLIEKFESEKSAGKIETYNEEATKMAFINPFLKDVLGWDITNRDEVSPEESVSRGRVDYGLKIDGKIKIFVEAKTPKDGLSAHTEQVLKYGYNKRGVPFVLLTNFEESWLFDVTVKPDLRNTIKGRKIYGKLNFYLDSFDDDIWPLSKESALNGTLDKLLLKKSNLEKLPVDKAILKDLKEWREALAKDIYKNNPALFDSGDKEKDAHYLKEITQKLLDRIVFMRSCEDRGLVHRKKLSELFGERTESIGTNTMLLLKEEFKSYNNTFDSDLFSPKEWEANLAIDFPVMEQIIKETYNPYQFDVIPLEVLGNIYEEYLGYTIKLTEQQVKYEMKPDVRKAGGVYYTPQYIVDYIVQNTIGKLLKELPPKKIKELKILDPACGSGSFLIRAYEEMINYYRRQKKLKLKHSAGQKKLQLKDEEQLPQLDIFEKRKILLDHIFGVDLDEQAVEVTKLSLMLKMLDGESFISGQAVLPMLNSNIKCGNSLVSGDAISLKKYFGDDWYKVKPFNWDKQFDRVMKKGGFDVVIGNPPYGALLSSNTTKYLLAKFESQDYQLDSYILFLEKSLSLLRKSGLFGMIIPNTWLLNIQSNKIRQYVFSKTQVENIVHYRHPVFLEATVDTEIVIIRKVISKSASKIMITVVEKDNTQSEYFIPQQRWQDTNGKPVNILERPELTGFANKLRRFPVLDKVCIITQGAKPFQVGKGSPHQTRKIVDEKPFVSEKKLNSTFRPLLRGSLIQKYQILWNNAYWISFGDWLAEPRYSAGYDAPEKIVIRQTGDSLVAVIDQEQFIVRDNLYTILPSEKDISLHYILGLLNSRLLNWFYQTIINPEKGEALAQVKRGHLAQLPVRKINLSSSVEKKLYSKMIALVNIMLALNKKIQAAKGNEKDQLQNQITETDREIDELVYKLYGLTPAEIKIVEGNL